MALESSLFHLSFETNDATYLSATKEIDNEKVLGLQNFKLSIRSNGEESKKWTLPLDSWHQKALSKVFHQFSGGHS